MKMWFVRTYNIYIIKNNYFIFINYRYVAFQIKKKK